MTELASLLQNTITNIITKIMKIVATKKKYIHTKNFTQNEISKNKKCKKIIASRMTELASLLQNTITNIITKYIITNSR